MRRGPFSWLAVALFVAVSGLVSASGAAAASIEALSVDPAWVPVNTAPASAIAVIRGIGFTPATTVAFDGVAATVTFVDSRTLQVQVPTSATGKVARIVASDGGESDDIFPFIYTSASLYVKPLGSDSGNGQTPGTAKKTINAALNGVSGTTTTLVRVAAGTYNEVGLAVLSGVVVSGGWDPTFTTHDPDQFVSVVDAGGTSFAMRSGGLDASQVIDGLTIRNGVRDGFGGGAFVISADNTVISNSVLVGNTSSSRGGAVYAVFTTSYGGRPTLSKNVMLGNRVFANAGGGIGIYPFYTQGQDIDVAVTDNYILGNRSFGNRGGGLGVSGQAVYTYNVMKLELVGNVFGDNLGVAGAGASIIAPGGADSFDLLVDNNLFFGNTATGEGGGLLLSGVGRIDGRISGNTFASNTAGLDGGGGYHFSAGLIYQPTLAVQNLIVWGNTNGSATGMPLATFSDIEGGSSGTGNIAGDPGFTSGPMGSFYLMQDPNTTSPAVDAGSDAAGALSMDALTTSSTLDPDTGMVDMGYHYPAGAAASADPLSFVRIDPAGGDVAGSDWVLIRGKGFDPGVTVTFDGIPALGTIFASNSRILTRPPAHAAGAVTVVITNPDMTDLSLPAAYTYLDNQPPFWPVTVGLQTVALKQDCVRSAVLGWNPAQDMMSSPVRYTIHRTVCVAPNPGDFRNPCSNFGFIPDQSTLVTTTTEPFYVDTDFGGGGSDPVYIYLVRASDSASPTSNREFNYAKRVVTVGKTTGDLTPPAEVGDTLVVPSAGPIDWAGAFGAVSYRLYRETDGSAYGSPGSLVPLITLDTSNNDLDGNGVTDSQYTDPAVPAVGSAYMYRVTALDPCGNETTSELVP